MLGANPIHGTMIHAHFSPGEVLCYVPDQIYEKVKQPVNMVWNHLARSFKGFTICDFIIVGIDCS